MPVVSVIIPNYNHGKYLQQRIDSVLNQSYQDFEVIILDDCSTDNSKEVIERYRTFEKVTRIVYNPINSGSPFTQWNRGIEIATGDYVWIAESDDWCEPTLLETLVSGITQYPDSVVGYCQSSCISDNQIKFQTSNSYLAQYIKGDEFIKDFLLPKNPIINASMAIFKREAYSKISNEFINYKIAGDYYFWIELCTTGNIFISGKLLNYFRHHDKNVSDKAAKTGHTYQDQINLLSRLLDRQIIDRNDYLIALKRIFVYFQLSKRNLSKKNVTLITELFFKNNELRNKLKLYAFQKKIQVIFKRWIRV